MPEVGGKFRRAVHGNAVKRLRYGNFRRKQGRSPKKQCGDEGRKLAHVTILSQLSVRFVVVVGYRHDWFFVMILANM